MTDSNQIKLPHLSYVMFYWFDVAIQMQNVLDILMTLSPLIKIMAFDITAFYNYISS